MKPWLPRRKWIRQRNKRRAAAIKQQRMHPLPVVLERPRAIVIHGDRLPSKPAQPCKKDTLTVITEFFMAQARFHKIYGVWSCVAADPPLRWMIGKSRDAIKLNLLKMGAQLSWASQTDRPRTTVQGFPS